MERPEKKRRPAGHVQNHANGAAVVALLSERADTSEITMPLIAERAGVAASKLLSPVGRCAHVAHGQATVARLVRDQPLPDTGSLRGDLRAWARAVATSMASPRGAIFLRVQLGFGDPGAEGVKLMAPRLDQIEVIAARTGDRAARSPATCRK